MCDDITRNDETVEGAEPVDLASETQDSTTEEVVEETPDEVEDTTEDEAADVEDPVEEVPDDEEDLIEDDDLNEDESEDIDEPIRGDEEIDVPNVTVGTIIRTILLAIGIINLILTCTGHSPLPFDSEDVNLAVSVVYQAVVSVIAWWKDNDFTTKARTRKAKSN